MQVIVQPSPQQKLNLLSCSAKNESGNYNYDLETYCSGVTNMSPHYNLSPAVVYVIWRSASQEETTGLFSTKWLYVAKLHLMIWVYNAAQVINNIPRVLFRLCYRLVPWLHVK